MRSRDYRNSFLFVLMILGVSQVANAGTFSATSRADAKQIKYRVLASQFLSQATFGPIPAEVEALADRMGKVGVTAAKEEWIKNQLSETATSHKTKTLAMIADDGFTPIQSGIGVNRYKYHAWWDTVISEQDQLRQRMAWALAQIFAVDQGGSGFNNLRIDASGQPQNLGIVDFYDMLVSNALGNYRDTLQDVTLHPIMGQWLSHVRNRRDRDPDENYAREVQQLFTIGLYKLKLSGVHKRDAGGELIPTYTNEEIVAFARVFTGLHYAGDETRFYSPINFHEPMIMFEGQHDQEEKVLHNGTVLPEGQSGMQDISDALDNLFQHPNCGPFISRLLIQRLVKSNPSRGYIRRVAAVFNDNGNGVRGDLAAVARAILMDKQAQKSVRCRIARNPWRLEVQTRGTEHTRLQEPVVRYASLIRSLGGSSDYAYGRFMIPNLEYHLNQMAYRPHHVFNFYDSEHVPSELFDYSASKGIPNGSIFAPEFQILTAVAGNRLANRFRAAIVDGNEFFRILNNQNGVKEVRITFDLDNEIKLVQEQGPAALMEHLDLLLASGTMNDTTRDIIAFHVGEETTDPTIQARAAIIATLTCAECAVGQ